MYSDTAPRIAPEPKQASQRSPVGISIFSGRFFSFGLRTGSPQSIQRQHRCIALVLVTLTRPAGYLIEQLGIIFNALVSARGLEVEQAHPASRIAVPLGPGQRLHHRVVSANPIQILAH